MHVCAGESGTQKKYVQCHIEDRSVRTPEGGDPSPPFIITLSSVPSKDRSRSFIWCQNQRKGEEKKEEKRREKK